EQGDAEWNAGTTSCARVLVRLKDGRLITVGPATREVLLRNDVVAKRTQITLCVAAALTVHKSQGMTLDEVVVDGSDIFTDGHFYVAVSRCRSLEGLTLVGVNWARVTASQKVIDFYVRALECK
ncbi:MAG TPA: helicase C-terminal domain-containing protein, partial [Ramlibacter sp.]|nr:helicase C-terminal domain-containing protein [Ramlibacter sp.]